MKAPPWARFLKVIWLDQAALVELRPGDLTEDGRHWLFALAHGLNGRSLGLDLENVAWLGYPRFDYVSVCALSREGHIGSQVRVKQSET